jgi:hypothetical protein
LRIEKLCARGSLLVARAPFPFPFTACMFTRRGKARHTTRAGVQLPNWEVTPLRGAEKNLRKFQSFRTRSIRGSESEDRSRTRIWGVEGV